MSTDLLAIFHQDGRWSARAVSVKPNQELSTRAQEKLDIERNYWKLQGVQWELFTVDSIPYKARMAMLAIADHILPYSPPDTADRELIRATLSLRPVISLAAAIEKLAAAFETDREAAQRLFWQAVWLNLVPHTLQCGFGRALMSGHASEEELRWRRSPDGGVAQ